MPAIWQKKEHVKLLSYHLQQIWRIHRWFAFDRFSIKERISGISWFCLGCERRRKRKILTGERASLKHHKLNKICMQLYKTQRKTVSKRWGTGRTGHKALNWAKKIAGRKKREATSASGARPRKGPPDKWEPARRQPPERTEERRAARARPRRPTGVRADQCCLSLSWRRGRWGHFWNICHKDRISSNKQYPTASLLPIRAVFILSVLQQWKTDWGKQVTMFHSGPSFVRLILTGKSCQN